MEGAITIKEFKERNNRFNSQISAFEEQLLDLRQQEQQSKITEVDPALLEKALWEELSEVFEAYQNEMESMDSCAGCPGAGSSECDGCNK